MLQPNEQTVEHPYANRPEAEETQGRKESFLLPLLFFITGLAIGCAQLFYKRDSLELPQLAAFFLLGVVYATTVQKRGYGLASSEAFPAAFFFAVALLVTTGIVSYFGGALHVADLFLFAGAFLLPCTVLEAWRLFHLLAVMPKPVWRYAKEIPDEAPFIYLEKKPFHIRVLDGGEIPEEYTGVAPSSLSLGLAFFYTVKHDRSPEEWQPYFLDKDGRSYAWQFYTKKAGFWKTYLHPDGNTF